MRAAPDLAGPIPSGADLWLPIHFDPDLVRKYDRPGPRYTSYPTAPQFREPFGVDRARLLLETSAEQGHPLSLYVHLPFCETRCFFCGCNVVIGRDRGRSRTYLETLEREAERVAALARAADRRVVQLHWGGGTPNFLPPEDLLALDAMLRRHFPRAAHCEFGVEIDPRVASDAQIDALAEAGVNRLSLGVQDLDPEVQEAVNRVQPLEMTERVLERARRLGISEINIDLIYGLPHQTPPGFAATLDRVIALEPSRLAVFNFAFLPAMFPHQRVIDRAALPGADAKLEMLALTIERLTAAGYVFIGMDHFARPEDSLALALRERRLGRNFQGYSTWPEADLIGLGVSSISTLPGGYVQNRKTLPAYRRAIEARGLAPWRGLFLDPEDRLRRDVIQRLMCHFRLSKASVEAAHHIDFDLHFADELHRLRPLADDGLVELGDDGIEITSLGRLLVRNVAMVFDAYLEGETAVRYSRTV